MIDGLMVMGAFVIASIAIVVALIYPSKGNCTGCKEDKIKDEGILHFRDKKEIK